MILILHTVDGFDLERHTVDEDDLLVDFDTVDLIRTVDAEYSIIDECVLLTSFGIVDADDQRMVFSNVLGETEGNEVVEIKLHFGLVDVLAHSWVESYLLHIICLVGCKEHHRNIVGVFLLCHTGVDTNYTFY